MRAWSGAGLFPLLLAACGGDVAGPGADGTGQLQVDIRLEIFEHRRTAAMECDIAVRALVTGPAGARARWGGATLEVVSALDPQTVVSRQSFSASDVHGLIGTADVRVGDDILYQILAEDDVPFAGVLRQEYIPAWTTEVVELVRPFACGPQPRSGPAPEIAFLAAPDSMEPAQQGRLDYRVEGGAGLWRLDVHLNGTWYDAFSVELTGQTTDQGQLEFTVPPDLALGSDLSVAFEVTDLLGRVTRQSLPTIRMADMTPPSLTVPGRGCRDELDPCPVPVGREVAFSVLSSDASPHVVHYSLGQPPLVADSIVQPPYSSTVRLPVTDSLLGLHTMRIWATDEGGRRSEEFERELLVYPTQAAPTYEAILDGTVTDIAFDATRDRLYVGRVDRPDVDVLSTVDLTPLGTFQVGAAAPGVELLAGGDTLLAAVLDSGSIAVIDPAGIRATEYVPLGDGFGPQYVRADAAGGWIVQARRPYEADLDEVAVLRFDPGTGSSDVLETGSGILRRDHDRLVASDDRTRIVFGTGCVRLYSAGSVGSMDCRVQTHDLATNATGTVFATEQGTYSPTWNQLRVGHPVGRAMEYVQSVDYSPDGSRLLVLTPEGIHVLDTGTWLPTRFLPSSASLPTGRLDVSPDGTFAVAWAEVAVGSPLLQTRISLIDLTGLALAPGR